MPTDTTVANTILEQLGGSAFRAMTGAHSIVALEDGVQLRFRGGREMNCLRVCLQANDLYEVGFYRILKHGLDVRTMATTEDVPAENLRELFENATGLRTSL